MTALAGRSGASSYLRSSADRDSRSESKEAIWLMRSASMVLALICAGRGGLYSRGGGLVIGVALWLREKV